jgi:hypothetical protein
MALADVFDALICARVYKPAMSYDEGAPSSSPAAATISIPMS